MQLLASALISAAAAALAVAWIGKHGQSTANWSATCGTVSKFCDYIQGAIIASFCGWVFLALSTLLAVSALHHLGRGRLWMYWTPATWILWRLQLCPSTLPGADQVICVHKSCNFINRAIEMGPVPVARFSVNYVEHYCSMCGNLCRRANFCVCLKRIISRNFRWLIEAHSRALISGRQWIVSTDRHDVSAVVGISQKSQKNYSLDMSNCLPCSCPVLSSIFSC